MRLPRHDTSQSLPAEQPHEALAHDEALLDEVSPASPYHERWYVATSPAVIVGLGLRQRVADVVDLARCQAAGVQVLVRRAGGGAVLVDRTNMLCGAVCVSLPNPLLDDDLTDSYRWLGQHFSERLRALGVLGARRVDVEEARSDVTTLKARSDRLSGLLLTTCYAALSPHEVAVDNAKLVGLAQIRRRHAALFQFGVLLQDQSPLADLLMVPDELTREDLSTALSRRTVGLASLLHPLPDSRSLVETLSPFSGSASGLRAPLQMK